MSNDSTAPGFLVPVGNTPADDTALDALIQPVIVGLTGLPDAMVRIRGQETPAPQPSRSMTWCAFATTVTDADKNPSWVHDATADGGLGQSTQIRGEELEVNVSFYGSQAKTSASALRDGLGVSQNRATLKSSGLAYVSTDRITFVPDLENTKFVRRVDFVFRLRRLAQRTYNIRNIVSVQGQVISEDVGQSTPAVVAPIQAGP